MIDPVVLKGFRDSLPGQEIPKKRLISKLEEIFSLYGFSPIDTPALEYTSVLLGKGGGETDKQIFHFQDNGGREVALRFDLTVPFARFVASHAGEISRPFKRYHISKVWRGENPQKGRYREFYQCDFDIVGVDNAYSDAEILSTMAFCFDTIFQGDSSRYMFHLSHRGLFNEFLDSLGVRDRSVEILRTVDKLRKIGRDEVAMLLSQETGSAEKAEGILSFISVVEGEDFLATLARLEGLIGHETASSKRQKDEGHPHPAGAGGHRRPLHAGSVHHARPRLLHRHRVRDVPHRPALHRKRLLRRKIRQSCQPLHEGGPSRRRFVHRLIAALEDLGLPILGSRGSADLLIVSEDKAGSYEEDVKVASTLRSRGVRCDIYPFDVKKMKAVYDYCDRNGIPLVLIHNWKGERILKDTRSKESVVLEASEVAGAVEDRLS